MEGAETLGEINCWGGGGGGGAETVGEGSSKMLIKQKEKGYL